MDSASRRAITLRMLLFGTAVCGAVIATGATGRGAAAGAGTVATGAGAGPRDSAASTSAFTIRPFGPEPAIWPISKPACAAMRRASGLANTRSPEAAAGAGAIATGAAAIGAGAAGAGTAAGAAFGAAPAAGTASPASTSTAITSFTFTPCVPAGTRMRPRMPSSTASTSIVALSVSISAITSPALMRSPSCFSQRARLPSVMVGESAGIRIFVAMIFPLTDDRSRNALLPPPVPGAAERVFQD